MARHCPLKNSPALYLDCKECDERVCEKDTPSHSCCTCKHIIRNGNKMACTEFCTDVVNPVSGCVRYEAKA